MKILMNPPREQWEKVLARPALADPKTEENVAGLLAEMKSGGWNKVAELTERFDGYAPEAAKVRLEVLKTSGDRLPAQLKEAISLAGKNIRMFHEAQRRTEEPVEVMEGISCYRKWVPIDRIGLYIPGGTAPLLSTVLMLAIPAQIAGCREIVLCTPASREGIVDPAILYAAYYCGITNIYALGGVQAIAAMAYGLGQIPKSDKLFGPGNSYVTIAKQLVSREGVAIDMPAGPSELAVIADESGNPVFIAADLLSQTEHGPDSQVILLTSNRALAEEVNTEIEKQLSLLPRREIAIKALNSSMILVVDDEQEMIDLVNFYAPEHLIISTRNPREVAEQIRNAGSVFLGSFTPESAGDYASGTNHTLPTSGYARSYSGLSLDSFMKSITFQEITPAGLSGISQAIISLARAEGLEGHAQAVLKRRESGDWSQETGDGRSEKNKNNNDQLLTPVYRLQSFLRPNIKDLVAYSSARDEFSGKDGIFLDANESPYDSGLNRYPDPHQLRLKDRVAALKGISVENLFLGNGSDEAIDLLIRIFCEPGRSRIITMSPTYGMYKVCAGIQDVAVDSVRLDPDFNINREEVLRSVRFDTSMIFLCSPNNPTGNQFPLNDIVFLTERFAGIVVVDEAYIDFAAGPSALTELIRLPNLVILQTFSKAWGMAGARVGMAFADPEIIGMMDKVKYPYNLSTLSQQAVMNIVGAIRRTPIDFNRIHEIIAERTRLADKLKSIHCVSHVFPSEANFLLVRVTDAKAIYLYLVDQGIVVRDRSNQPLCENCLRISVGTPEENEVLIRSIGGFEEWVTKGSGPRFRGDDKASPQTSSRQPATDSNQQPS